MLTLTKVEGRKEFLTIRKRMKNWIGNYLRKKLMAKNSKELIVKRRKGRRLQLIDSIKVINKYEAIKNMVE